MSCVAGFRGFNRPTESAELEANDLLPATRRGLNSGESER